MAKANGLRTKTPVSFEQAIEAAEHLNLIAGLGAVKRGEGRDRISVEPERLLGSVNIDDDCRGAYPSASRWDYVIGWRSEGRECAVFVEVHSAETSDVSKVEKKLSWLIDFLNRESQAKLHALPRQIHWVASGRVNIPRHLPQFKKLQTTLRAKGLSGPPVTKLDLT